MSDFSLPSGQAAALRAQEVTLLDLLDRVIDNGVVLAGDVTISVADVDLIYLGLRVLLAPVERLPELLTRAGREERREVACE
ncbi:MAG: gas vesicle protein [Gemmatimonadaceae bacterium]